MGDETIDRPVTNSSQRTSTDRSLRTRKLWRSMTDLFGARWLESYGPEPSPLWANQIEQLDDLQVKRALQTILKSGAQHPPTLPEFLAYARNERVSAPAISEPETSREERAAGRWFLHRSLSYRFVGMSLDGHSRLRNRCIEVMRMFYATVDEQDPASTSDRALALLDVEAELIYPAANAKALLRRASA